VSGGDLEKIERPVPVITVDGPGGTGKGSLCLRLATHLGWHFLDSGALYRVLAQVAMEAAIALNDEEQLQTHAKGLDVRFECNREYDTARVLSRGRNLTEAIRTESCANAASPVCARPYWVASVLFANRRDWWPMGETWVPWFFPMPISRYS
jgi:CMP/dCMP kinase